ncbi:nucleotide sugar dehydrogenase [Sphingomonas sp. BN140010]|uniref:Nucleotide sugar dehydrogenase n=1 Tax=Sphingomonas arvum TaxID=2992113 RepID=A0ABT3JD17_9SPHN|nr:nucleotide sugar dehydrogenase [Sphingomonas sp. BN140010]MCW3796973.1 nucleotide sugar dehydrogenase [Sphingomonas sp. BN140010]
MQDPRIAVIGLGYVGLPLAVALAGRFEVIGLDSDPRRIAELKQGHDRTREVAADRLAPTSLALTSTPADVRGLDLYIVTVPTPVDLANQPDLGPLLGATGTVAGLLDPAVPATIVYESTVYPGVTEEICGPELERLSGLTRGTHFRLGYSPERINPGDTVHTVDKITKVVAAEDAATLDLLAHVYGAVNGGDIFRAASIRAAEAAKVIENAQRDINIAFMNELAQIFGRMDLSIWDVLDAARTKWNFLPFEPGLVGGHCIGVDPYYLSHRAQQLGHHPQIVLAGRETNDGMGAWIADRLHERLGSTSRVLVLGLTFKENVPDLRNSRVIDIIRRLQAHGHLVEVADPLADPAEARREYALDLVEPDGARYAMVVGAVPHAAYREWDAGRLAGLLEPGGCVADIKRVWNLPRDGGPFAVWTL